MSRVEDIKRLYGLFDRIEEGSGGMRRLSPLLPAKEWPSRGVYFFFDLDEPRTGSGTGPRLVRVGTHAVSRTSKSTLKGRLKQHAGNSSELGGNHRGSVFRLLIGEAMIERHDFSLQPMTWGKKGSLSAAASVFDVARTDMKAAEAPIEAAVSAYLHRLPLLSLAVDADQDGPALRSWIERNAIALASDAGKTPIDPPSAGWLGRASASLDVRVSGLWNRNHVNEAYDSRFLDKLETLIG